MAFGADSQVLSQLLQKAQPGQTGQPLRAAPSNFQRLLHSEQDLRVFPANERNDHSVEEVGPGLDKRGRLQQLAPDASEEWLRGGEGVRGGLPCHGRERDERMGARHQCLHYRGGRQTAGMARQDQPWQLYRCKRQQASHPPQQRAQELHKHQRANQQQSSAEGL